MDRTPILPKDIARLVMANKAAMQAYDEAIGTCNLKRSEWDDAHRELHESLYRWACNAAGVRPADITIREL